MNQFTRVDNYKLKLFNKQSKSFHKISYKLFQKHILRQLQKKKSIVYTIFQSVPHLKGHHSF